MGGSKKREGIKVPHLLWKSVDGTDGQAIVIERGTCRKIDTQGHTLVELWILRNSWIGFLGKELKPYPKTDGRREELGSEAHLGTSPGGFCPLCQGQ